MMTQRGEGKKPTVGFLARFFQIFGFFAVRRVSAYGVTLRFAASQGISC